MSFPRDTYPYTNFHELNLGYFIVHFREIFSQWADLYDQMLDWKDATTDELAAWKTGVEADLDQRETALRAELETWKAQTGQDIAGWEDATLAALTAWQTATQAVFEAIRVEAAGSATAAAASAGDAATAKTAAETAQAAAEAAAASVQASAAQIATNTGDIADLKTQISDVIEPAKNLYNKDADNSLYAYPYNGVISASDNTGSVYIPITGGKTYTLSKTIGNRFGVSECTEKPVVGGSCTLLASHADYPSLTVTTSNNANYLFVLIWHNTDTLTFDDMKDSLMVEEGDTATEYEPYKLTAIDDIARASVTALEASDAQAGKFKQIQATAVPMVANIGSALEFDISAMTGSGNASYTDGKWVFALGGTITGNIANIVANKKYIIELATEVQAGIDGDINTNPCTVTLADVSITFFSAADANWIIALTPTVSGTVALTVAMHENWNGKISAITVKPVNAVAGIPQKLNSIPLHANANSLSFGGQNNLLLYGGSGALNTSLGVNAQRDIDTGLWNTAFGYNTQLVLTQGKGNNAFGCFAQGTLKTGCYNNAFGESSQNHLVDGQWNDGFGIETQGMATSAKNNVAMGRRSQHLLQTGNFNTAIGSWSGFNYHGSSPEGKWAVKTSSYTTLIGGASTLKGADTGDSDYATALGYQSRSNKQGLALGAMAEADNGGIAIGYNAKAGQDEVVIGNRKIIFNQDGTVTWVAVT